MSWVGPILVVLSFATAALITRWQAFVLFGAASVAIMWFAWYPRLIIAPDGLHIRGPHRRFIPWSDLTDVTYRPPGRARPGGIALNVGGEQIAPHVPAVSTRGFGARAAREAVEHIRSTWRSQ